MSAFHLRLVNDKLNLRVIRPLLLLHDLQNIHLMILFCKVLKKAITTFTEPLELQHFEINIIISGCDITIVILKYFGGYFFFCRVLYILSIPSKGYDIYDICTTFLFLALLLINTMIKVKIFKTYARFSRRSLMVTDPSFRQISFTENRQGHCQSNPNCEMANDPSSRQINL